MKVQWTNQALADYRYWQGIADKRVIERIHALIKNIKDDSFVGIGKPEPLKHIPGGWWSRRITKEHRLVYRIEGDPPVLTIAQCRYHYD
jgi:toxin YoeB